jgi:hypothetical protein
MDSSGRLRSQEIGGVAINDLAKVIKDIEGDGKEELIVPSPLPSDTYRGTKGMAIWPAVYQRKGDQYVEASSHFPAFYESQVLPALDKKVTEARDKVGKGLATEHDLAIAVIARDKVLRVTGQSATAGLSDALEWMRSNHPELRRDAAAVLGDIGDHDQQLRALSADANPDVSRSARFAMRHGASSFGRFNSIVVTSITGP